MGSLATNQNQSNTSMQCATSETIKFLFVKFHARYGGKWTSQYPPDLLPAMREEWLDALNTMTAEDIKRGLDTWQEDWPPNIVEFKKACTKKTTRAAHREYKSLQHPVCSKETAQKNIAKLKEILHASGSIINRENGKEC